MPPKLKPVATHRATTLTSLRQNLKSKLIQIGMNLSSPPSDNKKVSKQTKLNRRIAEEGSLLLPSVRSKKELILAEFRELFLASQKQVLCDQEIKNNLQKEVIKGNKCKYNHSLKSSRNQSPNSINQNLKKEASEDANNDLKSKRLPSIQRQVYLKQYIQEWNKELENLKDSQSIHRELSQRYSQRFEKARRSKTEQNENTLLSYDQKKGKRQLQELGPWEFEEKT